MSCLLRAVPWANKAEWESVYDDAYSDDADRLVRACEMMETWQYRRDNCPPAIECTLSLISVMLKDKELNSKALVEYAANDLSLLYSSSIMRLINLVSSSGKKDRMTLKQIASVIRIPEWIVTLRNEVAHGIATVELGLLRRAALFLKRWLKENYWEVEKSEMQDWVIEKPRRQVIEDNVKDLIEIYVHLKKYSLRNYHHVEQIEDQHVRNKICNMSALRSNSTLAEILPWEHQLTDKERLHPKEIEKLSPTKAFKLALTYLRPYLKQDFWNLNTAQMLVDSIIDENSDQCIVKTIVWDSLIECMQQWGNLPRVMEGLAVKAVDSTNDSHQKLAALWLLQLTLATYKRLLCDKMKEQLSKVRIPAIQEEALDTAEGRAMKRIMLKRRLNMDTNKSSSTIEELMKRVEKQMPELKGVIRFVESRRADLPNRTVLNIIDTLVEKPNRHIIQCIRPLVELFDPPMAKHDVTNLMYLVKMYLGLAVLPLPMTKKMFTIANLDRWGPQESEQTSTAHNKAQENGEIVMNGNVENGVNKKEEGFEMTKEQEEMPESVDTVTSTEETFDVSAAKKVKIDSLLDSYFEDQNNEEKQSEDTSDV